LWAAPQTDISPLGHQALAVVAQFGLRKQGYGLSVFEPRTSDRTLAERRTLFFEGQDERLLPRSQFSSPPIDLSEYKAWREWQRISDSKDMVQRIMSVFDGDCVLRRIVEGLTDRDNA